MSTENISLRNMKFPEGCPKIEFYKHPTYCELVIYLFTKCNLNCAFCFQEHSADLDMNFINSIPEKALELLRRDFKDQPTIKQVDIRILGGELFSDNIPDSYFDEYARVINTIREQLNKEFPEVQVDFIITTNGVWKNRDRVINFLETNNFKKLVSISIDFVGRYPNNSVKQTAYDTVRYLSDKGFQVRTGLVMTKRNIQYILEHPDEFTGLITQYGADQIVFNFYIPNIGWEQDLPSDSDMINLFKFCLERKLFDVSIIFYLFEALRQKKFFTKTCECKYIPTIMDGCITKDCTQTASTLPRELFYGDYVNEVTEENVSDVKASLGVVKRGCLECEHYEYCPQLCWCLTIFKHFKAEKCPLQWGYEYIQQHPELWEEYNKWHENKCHFC